MAARWRELGFEWEEFENTFRYVRWGWVLGAAGVSLTTFFGRALRWRVLIRGVKPDANLWNLTSATAVGFTALVFFGRAGEFVRPYLIAAKEKLPFSSQVAAWVLERIYDLLTALLLFGFALSRVHSSGVSVGPNLSWVLRVGGTAAGIVGVISLTLLVLFSRYAQTTERRLIEALSFLSPARLESVTRMTSAFRQGMESSGSRSFVYLVSFYSVLEWALIVTSYSFLFKAFPATSSFNLTDVIIFVGFVAFGSVIQIPGVGGGVQVASVLILTELYGVGLEAASGVALLLWLITFVVIVPVGLLIAFHDGLNWHKLKGIKEDVSL